MFQCKAMSSLSLSDVHAGHWMWSKREDILALFHPKLPTCCCIGDRLCWRWRWRAWRGDGHCRAWNDELVRHKTGLYWLVFWGPQVVTKRLRGPSWLHLSISYQYMKGDCKFEFHTECPNTEGLHSWAMGRHRFSHDSVSLYIPWNIWTKLSTLPILHQLKCFNSEK